MTTFRTSSRKDEVVELEAMAGCDVRKCVYEALEVIRVIGGKIKFHHNGVEVIVDGKTPYQEIIERYDLART